MSTRAIQASELNKRNVLRFLEDTHSGRFDVIDELVAPEIRTHGFPGGRNPASRDEYKQFFARLDAAFPGMEMSIDAMVGDQDQVAARFTVSGVHQAEFAGVPRTGRRVSFGGMAIYRMRNGQIAETWLYPDNLALLQQLGAVPMPTDA
ncbi:MAG: ester cyclase [Burkholderiales bacterium]